MSNLRAQLTTNLPGFFGRQLFRIFVIIPWVLLVRLFGFFRALFGVELNPSVPYVVFISSVIYPSMGKVVSFGAVRSTYTPEERLQHTKQTIVSVRQHLPGAHIVLVEGGLEDVASDLQSLVDTYLFLGKHWLVRWACDGKSKSLGEAVMLWFASRRVPVTAHFYYKVSGRYVLDETFDAKDWPIDGFSFLVLRSDFFSTRLYGFSNVMFNKWQEAVLMGMPYHLMDYPIENTLMRFVPKKFLHTMTHLGVSGLGGSSFDQIKE